MKAAMGDFSVVLMTIQYAQWTRSRRKDMFTTGKQII